MKSVTITAQYTSGDKTYYPGPAVVSDAIATALANASLLSGDAIDYRPPNVSGQLVHRGAYDAETAYVIGDVVTEGGATFVAIDDSVGEDTDDTDFFVPLALEGGTEVAALLAAIPVSNLAALGATTNLTVLAPTATTVSASNVTLSTAGGNTYSDTAIKTAIDGAVDTLKTAVVTALNLKADNADVETLRTEVEARLDAIEAKVDAVIAKLITAKIMAA